MSRKETKWDEIYERVLAETKSENEAVLAANEWAAGIRPWLDNKAPLLTIGDALDLRQPHTIG